MFDGWLKMHRKLEQGHVLLFVTNTAFYIILPSRHIQLNNAPLRVPLTQPSTCMYNNSSKFSWPIMWPLPLGCHLRVNVGQIRVKD